MKGSNRYFYRRAESHIICEMTLMVMAGPGGGLRDAGVRTKAIITATKSTRIGSVTGMSNLRQNLDKCSDDVTLVNAGSTEYSAIRHG